jgi:glycosyltransferase involved in cell wall biosynthesis
MRIGWIPFSNDLRIASARLRCALPARYLAEAGWHSELLDRREPYGYDIAVFQKAYDEDSLALASRLRGWGTRLVFDLCDNHFYNPGASPLLEERAGRLRRILDMADAVTVSTEQLRQLIAERDPAVVDDALDELEAPGALRIALGSRLRLRPELRLVWFGNAGMENPSFGLPHLRGVIPDLEELHSRSPLRLTVISNSKAAYRKVLAGARFPHRYREWRVERFPRTFCSNDLCIVPVERNPFTVCKTANRVALSLRLGVPVVADPIPSLDELAPYILFGNWRESLSRYASDHVLRISHAREGRRYVVATYTRERVVAQWSAVFERLLAGRRPGDAPAPERVAR